MRNKKGQFTKEGMTTHDMSDTSFYHCWENIKARCLRKSHPMYKLYGNRGITLCTEWMQFDGFHKDMFSGYMPGLSIDRINNEKGYSKDNCRWIPMYEQQKNRRDNNENVGVVYDKKRKRWRADIARNGKRYFLGRFHTVEEAIYARDLKEKELNNMQ